MYHISEKKVFSFRQLFLVWCPANCPTTNVTELPKRGYILSLTLFPGAWKLLHSQDLVYFVLKTLIRKKLHSHNKEELHHLSK